MDECQGGVTSNYMTNEKRNGIIGLKKTQILKRIWDKLKAEDIHELLRAWELKHHAYVPRKCVASHHVPQETLASYYYRGDAMKLNDDEWHVLTVSRRDPKLGEYTMEKALLYHCGQRWVIITV